MNTNIISLNSLGKNHHLRKSISRLLIMLWLCQTAMPLGLFGTSHEPIQQTTESNQLLQNESTAGLTAQPQLGCGTGLSLLLGLVLTARVMADFTGSITITDQWGNQKPLFINNDTLYVKVVDQDLNTSNGAAQTVRIRIQSGVENDSITLTETGTDTSLFMGSIRISDTATIAQNNGWIKAQSGNNINVFYRDMMDAYAQTADRAAFATFASTCLQGTLNSDTLLTKAQSPHLIFGTFTIPTGRTMTLEPGASIKFIPGQNGQLTVQGNLIANGLQNDSIVFCSNSGTPAPGDWYKILIEAPANLQMRYCAVRHAYYGVDLYANYPGQSQTVLVRRSTFEKNRTAVFGNLYGASLLRTFLDSNRITLDQIDSNSRDGIYLYYSSGSDSVLSITNNTFNIHNISFGSSRGVYVVSRYGSTDRQATIRWNNFISDNANSNLLTAIELSQGTEMLIDSNQITRFKNGLTIQSCSPVITHNTFTDCGNSVFLGYSSYSSKLNYNAFLGSTGYALRTDYNGAEQTVDARYNYWDASATASMNGGGNPKNISTIRDRFDYTDAPDVLYAGWLSSQNGTPAATGHAASMNLSDQWGNPVSLFQNGDSLYVSLTDADLNTNNSTNQSVRIRFQSGSETDSLTLSEAGPDSALFQAVLRLETGVSGVVNDGILKAQSGDAITATYQDLVDAYGQSSQLTQSATFADIYLQGTLSSDTLLTKAQNPHLIFGTLTIPSGNTLTLEPGAMVKFIPGQNGQIDIQGTLIAEGTSSDSITFCSNKSTPAIGDWSNLYVESTGDLKLRYCKIQDANQGVNLDYYSPAQPKSVQIRRCDFDRVKTGIYGYLSYASSIQVYIDSNRINLTQTDSSARDGISLYYSSYADSVLSITNNTFLIHPIASGTTRGIKLQSRYGSGSHIAQIRYNSFIADSPIGNILNGVEIQNSDFTVIDSNQFTNLKNGAYPQSGSPNITHNTFNGCVNSVYLSWGSYYSIVNYNNFIGSSTYAIKTEGSGNGMTINARYNYWDATATAQMNSGNNPKNISLIYDKIDNSGCPYVLYSGWLSSQNGTPAPVGADGSLSITDYWGSPKTFFTQGDTLYAKVVDSDLNTNNSTVQSIRLPIQSGAENDSITLMEAGNDTTLFTGFIRLNSNASVAMNDNILKTTSGGTIVLSYRDQPDAFGQSTDKSAIATFATSYLQGSLTGDTLLTKAGSPHLINGTLTIPQGYTLTVESGASVKFIPGQSGRIDVQGTLIANGLPGDSILFCSYSNSPNTNDWYKISVMNEGALQMRYCAVRHASNGVSLDYNYPAQYKESIVRHCLFDQNRSNISGYLYSPASIQIHLDSNSFNIQQVDSSNRDGITLSYSSGADSSLSITYNKFVVHNSTSGTTRAIVVSNRSGSMTRQAIIQHNTMTADSPVGSTLRGIELTDCIYALADSNQITNFKDGIYTYYATVTLTHNVITNCLNGIIIGYQSYNTTVNYNSFINITNYAMRGECCGNGFTVDARYNYWGPAITSEMTSGNNPKNISGIYDSYDYGSAPTMLYSGWLTSPSGNVAPVITSTPLTSVKRRYAYAYQITATDANGDVLSYSLTQKPLGMTVNGAGLVQWLPDTAGSFNITVAVTDAQSAVTTQTYALNVLIDSLRPVNNYTLHANGVTDSALYFTWSTTGNSPDADSLGIWYRQGSLPTKPYDSGAVLAVKKAIGDPAFGYAYGLQPWTKYYCALFVRDSSGNWSLTHADSVARTQDHIKPVNLMTLTITRIGSSDSVNVSWNAAAQAGTDVDSVRIRFDSQRFAKSQTDTNATYGYHEFALGAGSFKRFGLFEKQSYYVTLFVRDSSSNWSDTTNASRFLLVLPDMTKPSPVINFSVSTLGNGKFRLTSNPVSLDVDSVFVRYRTDGVYPANKTDGTLLARFPGRALSDTITGLAENTTYSMTAFVRDSSGNWSDTSTTSKSSLYVPDITKPANITGLTATSIGNGNIRLTWTPSGSADAMSVMARIGTAKHPMNTTDGNLLWEYPKTRTVDTVKAMTEKTTYYFSFFVRDSSNNWSDTTAQAKASVTLPDRTPPANPLTLTATPTDSGFRLTWNHLLISDNDVQALRLLVSTGGNPSNPAGGGADKLIYNNTPVPDLFFLRKDSTIQYAVTYYFGLVLADSAGQFSTFKYASAILPNPTPKNVKNLTASTIDTGAVAVRWSKPDPLVDSVAVRLDTVAYRASGLAVASRWFLPADTSYTFRGLKYGTVYYVSAFTMAKGLYSDTLTDPAHASAATQSYTPAAPVITTVIADTPKVYADSLFTRTIAAVDANGDAMRFKLATKPGAMTLDSMTGVLSWRPGSSDVGVHAVTLTAQDPMGLKDTLAFFVSVQSNHLPPSFTTLSTPDSAFDGTPYTRTVQAVDPNGWDVLSYFIDKAPAGMAINAATGQLSWLPNDINVGDTMVSVIVNDLDGLRDTLTFALKVINVNDAPIITSTLSKDSVLEKAAYLFLPQATDPDKNDVLTWSLLTGPSGMNLNASTGQISITPLNSDVGNHPVSLRVTDAAGASDTLSYTLKIINVNDAPVFTTVLSRDTTLEDSPYSRTFSATDPDAGDALTFAILKAPAGMALGATSGTLTWLPDDINVGDSVVSIAVRDQAGLADTLTFLLHVTNVNDAPVIITSVVKDSVLEKSTYTLTLNAWDPDKTDVLSWSLLNSPAGLSIASASGILSWTPGNSDVGSHVIRVKVTDAAGAADTFTYTLRVININDAPVFASVLSRDTTLEDSPYSRTVSATDPDAGDVLAYSILKAPAEMTLNATSGTLTWLPDNINVGDWVVSIAVRDQAGLADTLTYELKVINTNDAPTLTVTEGPIVFYGAVKINFQVGDVDRRNGFDSTLKVTYAGKTVSTTTSTFSAEYYPIYSDTFTFIASVADAESTTTLSRTYTLSRPSGALTQTTVKAGTWSMISLPAQNMPVPSEWTASQSLYLYQWNKNNYRDPTSGLTSLNRGQGYWFLTEQEIPVTVTEGLRLGTENSAFTLPVDSGWNMIASPYAYAVNFDTAANGLLYTWSNTKNDYDAASDVLEPWKSYFFYSRDAKPLVFDGTPFNPDMLGKAARALPKSNVLFKSAREWRIALSAEAAHSRDRENSFGLSPDALPGIDALDQFEPPVSPVGGVKIAFAFPENERLVLNRAMLPSGNGTRQWAITVDPGSDKGRVVLTFDGLRELPPDLYVFLGRNNDYVNLREEPQIEADLLEKTWFTAVVTDDRNFINSIVRNYELDQNYPNPFNPATTIRFAVPSRFEKNGKPILEQPRVTLKVFDLRGRLVKTLVDGPHKTNTRFTVMWDGKTSQGTQAASGMYLYRIDVGGRYMKTHKMAYLK